MKVTISITIDDDDRGSKPISKMNIKRYIHELKTLAGMFPKNLRFSFDDDLPREDSS